MKETREARAVEKIVLDFVFTSLLLCFPVHSVHRGVLHLRRLGAVCDLFRGSVYRMQRLVPYE